MDQKMSARPEIVVRAEKKTNIKITVLRILSLVLIIYPVISITVHCNSTR